MGGPNPGPGNGNGPMGRPGTMTHGMLAPMSLTWTRRISSTQTKPHRDPGHLELARTCTGSCANMSCKGAIQLYPHYTFPEVSPSPEWKVLSEITTSFPRFIPDNCFSENIPSKHLMAILRHDFEFHCRKLSEKSNLNSKSCRKSVRTWWRYFYRV